MLSRVADSLFWMSRYMERTDGILRMLKINYASSQDDNQEFSWKPALRTFSYLDEDGIADLSGKSREVLQFMVTDKENENSVLNIITRARENARSAQDHITKELWQCLNDFYHTVRDDRLVRDFFIEDPISILDILIRQGLLYYGTMDVTMARGEGYAFISIGKFLERAVQTADILDLRFSDPQFDQARMGPTYWRYLLLSISGYELYLKTYRGGFVARDIIEQTVLSGVFPRSVLYSVERLHRYFGHLRGEHNQESFRKVEFLIGRILSNIKYSSVDSIIKQGLHGFLSGVKEDLYEVGTSLSQQYFAYS
jgi:uncharacterized alpha-E superfamily protein